MVRFFPLFFRSLDLVGIVYKVKRRVLAILDVKCTSRST